MDALSLEDRQYINLLAHLRKDASNLPMKTFQSTLPYYLSRLAVEHVTTLTATVLASGYWLPVNTERALALASIFQQATTLKYKLVDEAKQKSVFSLSRSRQSQMGSWIRAVMRGGANGNSLLRLSVHGGLNAGIQQISRLEEDISSLASEPQKAFITAMSESFNSNTSSWNTEFQPSTSWKGT